MNLISGKVVTRQQSLAALDSLQEAVYRTLSVGGLPVRQVIAACDTLSKKLNAEEHLPALLALGIPEERAMREFAQAKAMLGRVLVVGGSCRRNIRAPACRPRR